MKFIIMLLVSPVWLIPQPVHSHVQKTQIVVEEKARTDDPSGVLPIHTENVQPRDNQPVQEIKPHEQILRDNPQPKSTQKAPVKSDSKIKPSSATTERPGQTSYNGRHYSVEETKELIRKYASDYGISPEIPLKIAKCESGYRWDAANKSSSARGVFQYLSGTFANTPEGKQGLSVFDADVNVRAAVRHIAVHGTAPWNASKHCWK